MNVNPLSSINSTLSVGTVSGSSQTLGKDAFLQLLVTQLKNQDPLSPMDNTQFISEMAQFTSLEQMTNLANSFSDFQSSFNTSSQVQAASLIGKSVSAQSNQLDVISGQPGTVSYDLSQKSMVEVKFTDSDGNTIDTVNLGWQDSGSHDYTWSGLNSQGVQVPDGTYNYEITATQSDGTQTQLSGVKYGTVSGVKFESGTIYVTVNGVDYPLSDITQIS